MLIISLTSEQFAAAKVKIEQELGQSLAVPSGTIEHEGVKLSYSYDGSAMLTMNTLHKPFIISTSTVEQKITSWFTA